MSAVIRGGLDRGGSAENLYIATAGRAVRSNAQKEGRVLGRARPDKGVTCGYGGVPQVQCIVCVLTIS